MHTMPLYCIQVGYTPERVAELVRRPQDRLLTVKGVAEKLGGKVIGGWIQLSEYDVMIIIEMTDIIDAAAMSMAFYAGGAIKAIKTTPLLTIDEAMQATQRAAKTGYAPPST